MKKKIHSIIIYSILLSFILIGSLVADSIWDHKLFAFGLDSGQSSGSPYGDIMNSIGDSKKQEEKEQQSQPSTTPQSSPKMSRTPKRVVPQPSSLTPGVSVKPKRVNKVKKEKRVRPPLTAGMKKEMEKIRKEREKLRVKIPPSTIDLIEEDAVKGNIDYSTSLTYRAYAIFNDKRLPRKYRTKKPVSAATVLFREIRQNYNILSPKAREALIPFLVNPLHPKSIFNQQDSYSSFDLFHLLDLVPSAYADTKIPVVTDQGNLTRWKTEGGWKALTTRNRKIKIWYKSGRGDKRIAKETKKYFDNDRIREKEVGLMGVAPPNDRSLSGDDGLFDIWFYPINDYGLTFSLENRKRSSSTLIIDRSLKGNKLKAALAHELFHAIQFNYNSESYTDSEVSGLSGNAKTTWIKKRNETSAFLMESTATWAEDFVYKGINTEQEYLPDFFKKPEWSLYNTKANHEYGAYIFYFYFNQKYGPDLVRKIWEHRENGKAPLDALMQAAGPDFRKRFKEFALWNWNRNPFLLYKDNVKFPKKGMKFESYPLSKFNLLDPITAIAPLAAYYLALSEKDPAIRKVRFISGEFNKKRNTGLWAVVKIKGKKAVIEDWSSNDERVFCFDDPNEDLEKITLIHVNADEKNEIAGLSQVERSNKPCSPKLDLVLKINGSKTNNERISSDTTITESLSISGQAAISVAFEEKPIMPNIKTANFPGILIPTGTFSYNLISKKISKRQWKGGSYRPPLGSGILMPQRQSSGGSDGYSSTMKIIADANWQGEKDFNTLYQNPSITMSVIPPQGKRMPEYSIHVNVEGRWENTNSTSSGGKVVNGVITSEGINESDEDHDVHPVRLDIKAMIPKGITVLDITEEHIIDKELVFPSGLSISYPEAKISVKGTLNLFEIY